METLRIVVLDNAWMKWSNPEVREFFCKIVGLKQAGYGKEYPESVLPVDASDFVGTHFAVCIDGRNGLEPVMAYRSITKARADAYTQTLGGLHFVQSLGAIEHEQAIKNILEDCERRGVNISYDSSWTIRPDIREDRELTLHLREIMQAMHTLYHAGSEVPEVIAVGATRFKMERLYEYWGYNALSLNGKELSRLTAPSHAGSEAIVFHLAKIADRAVEDAHRFRSMWDERILLGENAPKMRLPEAA